MADNQNTNTQVMVDARFSQKIDSYINWQNSSLVLNKGELAIVEIPSTQTATGLTPPAVGVKVGNGKDLFKDLAWIQSTAGDVFAWAKKENLEFADLTEAFKTSLEGLVNNTVQDTNTTYQFSFANNVLKVTRKEKGSDELFDVAEITLDLTTKIDKVTGAEGKLAQFKADGNIESTGVAISTLETKENAAKTYETIANVATLSDNVGVIKGRVDTLVGGDTDAGKSVRTIANEELAAQLLGETIATDNFKTLQELAAWLEDHPEEAAEYNQRIATLEGKVGNAAADGQNATGLMATAADHTDRIVTLENAASNHGDRIGALETTVGDEESGLVKELADLKEAIGLDGTDGDTLLSKVEANADAIDALELAVSGTDGKGGLTGVTTDHAGRIVTLENAASDHGGRIGTLEAASTDYSGRISTLETTVGDANSGLVQQVNTNTSDISSIKTTIGSSTSGMIQQIETLERLASTAVQTINGVEVTRVDQTATVTGVPVNLLKNATGYTLVFNAGTASTVI